MKVKQSIIVRTDLNMRKGKVGAQASHASRAFLADHVLNGTPLTEPMKFWLETDHDTICLGVSSEQELLDLYVAACDAGLPAHLVTDLGKTEFHGNETRTCVAIGPALAADIDTLTKNLKLL